ncbi:MAG: PEP-CTERM sorting domain-containing protein [Phycisphaerae bacterium]
MVTRYFSKAHSSSLVPMAIGTLAVAAIAAVTGTSSAAVIYQDSFSGSANTSLAGQAPTIDNGSSATWNNQYSWDNGKGYFWTVNGDVSVSGSGDYSAVDSLNFTPVDGHAYTISANLDPASGGGFMAFGFTNGDGSASGGRPFFNTTGPWMTSYLQSAVQGWAGPGNTNSQFNDGNMSALGDASQIVLNTAGADWTVQWLYNGTTLGSYTYSGTSGSNPNPTGITEVAIGAFAVSGSIGDFSLASVAVPEPATLGLAAMGGLGLLLLKRRKTTV